MKRGIFFLAITVGFIFVQGCRISEMEWGWKTERPQKIRKVFSHQVHERVLKKEGFTCFACHPMEFLIKEEKEEEKMYDFSKEAFFPGKETCHFCHFNAKAVSIAPRRCSICHFNLLEIQPANHNFDWTTRHTVYAKADAGDCESCHDPRFCEDCHKRRDLPTRRVHDRNYRFVHGIEARVNPSACGSCHELDAFCNECHIRGGYEK